MRSYIIGFKWNYCFKYWDKAQFPIKNITAAAITYWPLIMYQALLTATLLYIIHKTTLWGRDYHHTHHTQSTEKLSLCQAHTAGVAKLEVEYSSLTLQAKF